MNNHLPPKLGNRESVRLKVRLKNRVANMNTVPTLVPPDKNRRVRFCGGCGYQNSQRAKVCINCTAPLGVNCTTCGQAVPGSSKFCGQCGTPLSAQQPSPQALSPPEKLPPNLRGRIPTALGQKISTASVRDQGERREVTVLFLDVTNFTAVSHQLDSEEVYLLIDEAMSVLVKVIHKYEGTIDKFTGDGLMALFGVPVAHENDPERAIRAALDMQRVLQPLQARVKQAYNFNFQTRIGINTGPVIAGNLGSNEHTEYTVIGDTVNTASRLETAADPSTILISRETYQRTRSLFEFQTLPALTVKGIPDPVQAFRPLAPLERPGRVSGLAGLQVPMVGRISELDQLVNALDNVRQHGQPQIALITGEAGLGKSRLVSEFRRMLTDSQVGIYEGTCLDYTRITPLWVMIDLIRNIMHLPATASDNRQQQSLDAYLEQLELVNDEILPYLNHILGLSQSDSHAEEQLRHLDADMMQRQIHTALRQLLMATAQRMPTVLVFEDVHWIDPASRAFLEYWIQTSSDVPHLLILVSRQAERETIIKPLLTSVEKMSAQLIDIQLQPLSDPQRHLLVDQLIKQKSPEAQSLKKRIVDRADGNPFFVEEIIRMLLDQKGLVWVQDENSWHVLPQVNDLVKAVPGTVKDLILARFDRLPERVRRTLQKAAVLGAFFPAKLLETVSDTDPKILATHLDQLEAQQFLTNKPFRSEPGYVFHHALTQEAVYGTLLKRNRRQLHTRVAQAIEQDLAWSAEAKAEALAYHYAESATPVKATPFLIAAAENAARRCAHETAVEHYRRAIDLSPQQPENLDKEFLRPRLGLGRSLKYTGEFIAADQTLIEVLEYLRPQTEGSKEITAFSLMLVECLHQLADVRQRKGNYDEAIKHLEAGLEIINEDATNEHSELWRLLLERLAWIRFRQGQLEEAQIIAKSVLEKAGTAEQDDPITLARLYNTLGGVNWQQGRREVAVQHVQRSLQLYDSIGYLWGVGIAYGNMGILYDVLDNWPKAAECHKRAQTLQQSIGDIEGQANSFDNVGLLHLVMGEHHQAKQELQTGLTIRERLGDSWGIAQSNINLAHLAIVQAQYDQAASYAQAALSLAEVIGSSEGLVPAYWILAMVQAEQGELQTGVQSAEQALAMARNTGFMEGETDCLRILGILQARLGDYSKAEAFLQDSVSLSQRQNTSYRQALALLELGRLYQQVAQVDQPAEEKWRDKALTIIHQAIEKFESLGAAYDLYLARATLARM